MPMSGKGPRDVTIATNSVFLDPRLNRASAINWIAKSEDFRSTGSGRYTRNLDNVHPTFP